MEIRLINVGIASPKTIRLSVGNVLTLASISATDSNESQYTGAAAIAATSKNGNSKGSAKSIKSNNNQISLWTNSSKASTYYNNNMPLASFFTCTINS